MTLYEGDVWRPRIEAKDGETKAPVEPASLVCEVIAPSGKKSTVTATKIGEGVYKPAIKLTESGWWRLNVESPTGEYEGFGTAHIQALPRPTVSA
jgi:YtkA-like